MVRGYPEYKKRINEFFDNGTIPCFDCGLELPAGDDTARQAHSDVCPKKHPDNALTSTESERYRVCNEIIGNGIKIWYQVGDALLTVRDERLYRTEYATFEDYCESRWSMTRRHVDRLIAASQVVENLRPIGLALSNESQARELVPFAPDEQRLLVQVGRELYPDGKYTAADLKSLGIVLREITSTGAIDDGTGEQIPIASATPAHFKAAIIEETYERLKRQTAHIQRSSRKTKLLHTLEFEAASEFDLANLALTLKRQCIGKHVQIVIKEVADD